MAKESPLFEQAPIECARAAQAEEVVGEAGSGRRIANLDAHFDVLSLGRVRKIGARDEGARTVDDYAFCVKARSGLAGLERPGVVVEGRAAKAFPAGVSSRSRG